MRLSGSKGRSVKEAVLRLAFGKFLGSLKGVNIPPVLENLVLSGGDMNGF